MPDGDMKRFNFFDRESSGPVRDVIDASAGSQRSGARLSTVSSSARVVGQPDAKKLVSVEPRPVEGKARLRIGLKVSALGLRILESSIQMCVRLGDNHETYFHEILAVKV